MKRIYIALLSILLTSTVLAADVLPGVSRELARERRECLDSVKYNLVFHYPTLEERKFCTSEEILFHYSGGLQDYLQIDFEGEALLSCIVNGAEINAEWRDGHILIPKDLLHHGENRINLKILSGDKALNPNPDYLYTLFVPANAHSAFVCFDQPDIKAMFTPTLVVPRDFECMSSMAIDSEVECGDGKKSVSFRESPPLPTYLMSWVIGDFRKEKVGDMQVFHTETDSLKVAQIPEMCEISAKALRWLEDYTDVAYPFEKYDFAIIPGFQFGGMEHPGAIFYPPERMFLSAMPTPEEILRRYELVAHETSHMWFGDLVTMRWFDDVWTKEVFANFMASKISSEAFPDIDHNFNFIRANYPSAYSTDRTDGTHPIAQDLENLNKAGLVYGNIIYNKAPVMMRMLEKRMGEERLRDGLRAYLKKFAFANSSWDELIELLDSIAPDADVKGFSEAWVKKSGMPTITTRYDERNRALMVSQSDPTGAETIWPQTFSMLLIGNKGCKEVEINLFEKEIAVPLDTADIGTVTAIIPNSHGDGYGYFRLDNIDVYLDNWETLGNDGRYGAILNLENVWVKKDVHSQELADKLLAQLSKIDNPIIAAAATDILSLMVAQSAAEESLLWDALEKTEHPSVKQRLLRSIYGQSVSDSSVSRLYALWEAQSEPLMDQRDYMAMAYRLAILLPDNADSILATQRSRISDNQNLTREFDFISRACTNDTDSLLKTLTKPENRRPEPWSSKLVALIFDPARTPSTAQIQTALDMLPDIQATGGIFFPTNWARAVTGGLLSPESKRFLIDYCNSLDSENPLHRKLLESSYLSRTFAQ